MAKLIPNSRNLCSEDATKMISIKINNECNCCCPFCVDRGGYNPDEINVDAIAKAAIELKDYRTVIITGGEPFLVFNEVVELCEKLWSHKKRIVLNTNGTMLSPYRVVRLNPLIDELQISIHCPVEEKNSQVFGRRIHFADIQNALKHKRFVCAINSTFSDVYDSFEDKAKAIESMELLACTLGADKLRLTELKKVKEEDFREAAEFFPPDHEAAEFMKRNSKQLIEKGCTYHYQKHGLLVSVKRLCEYAKGETAPAFSCCFINTEGQTKIDVKTKDTFKVIYSDGTVKDDWVFNKEDL